VGQLPNVQTMEETSWISPMATAAFEAFGYGSSRGLRSHLSNVAYEQTIFMRRIGEAIDAIVQDCYEERCRRLYGDFRANGELRPTAEYASLPFQVRRTVDEPKQRWIDGTPFNTYFTWALVQMFPEAKFIHNLRRPEDVATSLEGFDNIGQASVELADGLRLWYNHTEHAWLAERAFGSERVYRLDFARLTDDREALFQEVATFLGEPYTPDMLDPLAARINSSDVDARRAECLERLQHVGEFAACMRLHAQVQAHPPGAGGDEPAMAHLRSSFLAYASQHPLL
jgi:hypothetical protein